jgi:cystathionine gamma-synthase
VNYLNAMDCPAKRPSELGPVTQALHDAIDENAALLGSPVLHPEHPTLMLDLSNGANMVAWQEGKSAAMWLGETSWAELPPVYGRYGTRGSHALIGAFREMYHAKAALVVDCGMQAVALAFDAWMRPGAHAILCRQVYNKSRVYLERLTGRLGAELTLVDDGDFDAIVAAIRPNTRLLFCETFTNPLMRAQDPAALSTLVVEARKTAPNLRLVVDDTLATPWGPKRPLLAFDGIDVVVGSGTKAIGGQDVVMSGYVVTNDVPFANGVMDLVALRGGILDHERAVRVLAGLPQARDRHARRCESALRVAGFLADHPRVESVWHPSVSTHPDYSVAAANYDRLGSLLSFRVRDADESEHGRLADVLASFRHVRYALSFDGLVSKVNHHKTVSEYFTPPPVLKRLGFHRLIRFAVGLEDPEDLLAALNWTLWHG